MLSVKALSLAGLLLLNTPLHVAGWKFETNAFEYLASDIEFQAVQLMEETRHMTGDGGGLKADQIVMGSWDDDWVKALGYTDGDFVLDLDMDGNHTLVERQTTATCGIPSCNNPSVPPNDELQNGAFNLRATKFICGAIEYGALPVGLSYIGVRVTGFVCGPNGSRNCQFGVAIAAYYAGTGLTNLNSVACQTLINRAGEYCESVGGSKTCQISDGSPDSQTVSVRTTITDGAGALNCPGSSAGGTKYCKELDFTG